MGEDMREAWEAWEGRTVDGKYVLQSYLGSSDHSAVFLTVAEDSQKAAIKLMPANGPDREGQLRRWEAARELSHPNLMRIFAAGRGEIDTTEFLYVVEEYAEENLGQIIPDRALTADEAREVLPPILQALQFLYGSGFVHGHVQPSNILATGNQVKLSSDNLRRLGEPSFSGEAMRAYDPPEAGRGALSPAGDVWQLGMTLVEMLTRQLPAEGAALAPMAVPQPFREIAQQCLQVEPGKRWTVAQIANRLRPAQPEMAVADSAPSSPVAGAGRTQPASRPTPARTSPSGAKREERSAKWPYAIALIAAVVLVAVLIARSKPGATSPAPTTASSQESAPVPAAASGGDPNSGRVAERVVPAISSGALRSIKGKIHIKVGVKADDAGTVTAARLETAGPSKYFAGKCLEAARGWKFQPPVKNGRPVASEWVVQFALTNRAIDDSADEVKP